MKKFLTILFVLSLVLSAVTVVHATGPTAVSVDLLKVAVDNTNVGKICNFTQTGANSGDNFTWGASSGTGGATAGADVGNTLNSSNTAVAVSDSGSGPLALNMEEQVLGDSLSVSSLPDLFGFFGFGSKAVAADLTFVDVDNFNFGTIGNVVNTSANSGENWTFGGTSQTGGAVAGATVKTTLNSNTTGVSITDTEDGPMAVNMKTFYSDNIGSFGFPLYFGSTALALDGTLVDVSNFNMGYVSNKVDTDANTGDNFTWGGLSMTGDALAAADVSNDVNKNKTNVAVTEAGVGPVALNDKEKLSLELDSASLFGSVAVAGEVNLAMVDNVNNGLVLNNVNTMSNTGENLTFGGNSGTGMALAYTTVGNNVNSNTTGVAITDTSSPTAMNVSSQGSDSTSNPCLPEIPGTPCGGGTGTGGTTAANVGTSGTAVAVDATVASVSNENTGSVVNNTTTVANSGDNTTKGCGQVTCPCATPKPEVNTEIPSVSTTTTTGDAVAGTSVSNTVNTNTTTVVITN